MFIRELGKIYKIIAERCLQQWHPELSHYAKHALFVREDFAEFERIINAGNSIRAAIDGINYGLKRLGYRDSLPESFVEFVFFGAELKDRDIQAVKEVMETCRKLSLAESNEVALDALDRIHNQWTLDSTKVFFSPEHAKKQFLFLHSLLIGWSEVKKDLVFLAPIADYLGLVIKKPLGNYNRRSLTFVQQENIDQDNFGERIFEDCFKEETPLLAKVDPSIKEALRTDRAACLRMAERAMHLSVNFSPIRPALDALTSGALKDDE